MFVYTYVVYRDVVFIERIGAVVYNAARGFAILLRNSTRRRFRFATLYYNVHFVCGVGNSRRFCRKRV